MVANRKKKSTIGTLDRAGIWSGEHPNLGVQWPVQTIEIMTAELPLTMVNDYIRSRVHLHHRIYFSRLGRLSEWMRPGWPSHSVADWTQ